MERLQSRVSNGPALEPPTSQSASGGNFSLSDLGNGGSGGGSGGGGSPGGGEGFGAGEGRLLMPRLPLPQLPPSRLSLQGLSLPRSGSAAIKA